MHLAVTWWSRCRGHFASIRRLIACPPGPPAARLVARPATMHPLHNAQPLACRLSVRPQVQGHASAQSIAQAGRPEEMQFRLRIARIEDLGWTRCAFAVANSAPDTGTRSPTPPTIFALREPPRKDAQRGAVPNFWALNPPSLSRPDDAWPCPKPK